MPDALLASSTGIARLYAVAVGENKAAAQPPGQADAATAARTNADARAKVLGWARRTIDLIPTSWLITGAGAVLLATTAAFGGLATAPADPVPEVAVGDTYVGSGLEITVVGVELWDETGNSAIYPDEEKGEKVLVVAVDVVNTFEKPRSATSSPLNQGSVDAIRIVGLDETPSLSHRDDGESSGMLQPDVPARLLLAWRVGADDFHDGDVVSLTLPDTTHRVGDNVLRGEDLWEDLRVGATLTATVEKAAAS